MGNEKVRNQKPETRNPNETPSPKPETPDPELVPIRLGFRFLVSGIHSDFGFRISGFDESRRSMTSNSSATDDYQTPPPVSFPRSLLAAECGQSALIRALCLIRIPFSALFIANGKICALGLKAMAGRSIERVATDCSMLQGKQCVTKEWVGRRVGGRSGSKGNSPAWEKML